MKTVSSVPASSAVCSAVFDLAEALNAQRFLGLNGAASNAKIIRSHTNLALVGDKVASKMETQ